MAVDDVINQSKSRLEALTAPIDGGAGADVSFEDQFDRVKNEVDKMTSMEGGKVEWPVVISNCEEMLSVKGKDFRVALYFAAARSMTGGLEGLLDGFVLLQELDEQYWTTMGPALKRPKARGNLCEWFAKLVAVPFTTLQPTLQQADLVNAIEKVSRGVDGDLADKLGEAYPGMHSIRSVIKNLVNATPKPPPPPPREASSEPEPVQVYASSEPQTYSGGASSGEGGLSSASITDTNTATAAMDEVGLILMRMGDALRTADNKDPNAYRLSRQGYWLQLAQTPPSDNSVMMIPGPNYDAKDRLEGFLSTEDWGNLIELSEAYANAAPLWLDPQRYIATALERLEALDARTAGMRELASMLGRAPGLHLLQFNDNTPLADDATRAWIEDEVQKMGGGGGGGGGGARAGSPLDKAVAEAKNLLANDQLPEGLTLVHKALGSVTKPVDRFRGRLEIAKLCLAAGQIGIARAQLDGLDKQAAHHRLSEWEPALCTDLYSALFAAHRGMNQMEEPTPEARARETAAFERLCQLDAGAALKLMLGQ